MSVLGLRFCARAFSSCGKRGPLFIAVRGPLTIAVSLVAEHRLQTHRLSNCGTRAQLLCGMWDLPRPGLEPVSPALAGRLSTTAPPGKPSLREFCKDRNKWKSEGAMSGEYGGWIRTSQPSCNSFCLVIKETCSLALTWWKIMCFLLTNSGRFSMSAAFSWSTWEQYLLEWIAWFSGRSS